jgi:hypothetical protein
MRRGLFTILSALSLLLFVASVVMWVRGRYRSDSITFSWIAAPGDHHELQFTSMTSMLLASFSWNIDDLNWAGSPITTRSAAPFSFDNQQVYFVNPHHVAGVWYDHEVGAICRDTICIPQWLIAAAALVFPGAWFSKRLGSRRRIEPGNRCHHCGYDLRATPDRCPECGTAARA